MFVGLVATDGLVLRVDATTLATPAAVAERILGRPLDRLPWWSWSDEERVRLRDALGRAAGRTVVRYDGRLRVDGRPLDVTTTVQPAWRGAGPAAGLVVTVSNRGERPAAKQPPGDGAERRRLALAAADSGEFEYDAAADALVRSPTVDRLFGFAPGAAGAGAAAFRERIDPEDRARVERACAEVLAGDRPRFDEAFRIRLPDGTTRWLDLQLRPVATDRGTRPFGLVRDVTPQRERAAALERALADAETLAREADHRIKNALQLVASLLELQLARGTAPGAREAIAAARDRIRTIAGVHDRLNRASLPGTVEIRPFLDDLCSDLARSVGGAAVTVDAADAVTTGDRAVRLGLIVNELATNAIRHGYGGASGPVRVSFRRRHGAKWCLSVEDDGAGMPDDVDPLSAGGLGMALVRRLAAKLGGAVRIERKAQGARVAVDLTLDD